MSSFCGPRTAATEADEKDRGKRITAAEAEYPIRSPGGNQLTTVGSCCGPVIPIHPEEAAPTYEGRRCCKLNTKGYHCKHRPEPLYTSERATVYTRASHCKQRPEPLYTSERATVNNRTSHYVTALKLHE